MKEDETEECKGSVKGFLAHDKEIRTVSRPPDTKRHTLEIQKLQTLIQQKESQFKMLQRSTATSTSGKLYCTHNKEALMKELTTLRDEREKDFQLRKHLDQELKALNTQVMCKNDSCSRLKAALRYKTEERIDDAIRRLEYQITVQQLTIREEKRMVAEIDSLRRSKKTLKEYLESRKVLDDLRTRQKTLRANRDACSRKINGCKTKEESIKATLDQLEPQADQSNSQETKQHSVTQKEALKKEIDELYNKKRELIASFNKERNDYYAKVKDSHAEAVQQRKIEALKRAEERNAERQVQLQEIRKQRTVHSAVEEQLTLCHNLIGYLEKQLNSSSGVTCDDGSTMEESTTSFHENSPAGVNKDEQAGQFLRRKSAPDDELVGLYAGLGRKGSKKGRKSRRPSSGQVQRKLVLHPDVIEQLLSLNLNVPGSASEIPHLLEELKDKQATLENPVEIQQPSKYKDENTGSGRTDVYSANPGGSSVSSDHNISDHDKMDTTPMSPISEENAPDFRVKSSKDDDESMTNLGKFHSEEVRGMPDDELNDNKTVDELKHHFNDDADLADDADNLEKVPSLTASVGENIKSSDLLENTEILNVKSKDSNKDFNESKIIEIHQNGIVSELAVEHGNSSTVCNGAEEKPLMSDLNSNQETALELAVERGNSSTVCNGAEEKPLMSDLNSDQETALELAVEHGNSSTICNGAEEKPLMSDLISDQETALELAVEHGNSSNLCNVAEEKPLTSNLNSDQEVMKPFKQELSTINGEVDAQLSSSLHNASQKSCAHEQVNNIEQRERNPARSVTPKVETILETDCSSCKVLLKENGLPVDEKFSQSVGAELRTLSCEKCPA